MSAISLKSITGITSITTPAGVDNQLTLHNNNTTEAVKLDVAGNLHFHNHLNITGVSTVTTFLQVLGQAGTSDKGFEVRSNSTQNTDTNKAIRIRNNSNADTFNISYKGKVTATELDISGNIDVDGHTNLDNVSIAGVTTITGSGNALEIVGGLVRSRNTASARFVANNGSAEGYFGWSSGTLTVGQAAATLLLEATGSNHIQLNTNGNERVRITSGGSMKVGFINNVNPTTVFDVMASAINQDIVRFTGANYNRGLKISTAASGAVNDALIKYDAESQSSAGQHAFLTDGTERLRIQSNGLVGIGTDAPAHALDIQGSSGSLQTCFEYQR